MEQNKDYSLAWKTTFQIALRTCSKEAGEKVSIYVILVKRGTYNQADIMQKSAAHLMKVAASHKRQMSLLVILVLF